MFFSQDILQRRGGKFGIVWLAATKCTSSLSRREYLTVSISKTCDDIVRYICLEARPLRPHGARPRLSLYLSSQLMCGVARVYGKQMEYLSAEVRDLYMRFSTAKLTMQAFEGTDLAQIKLKKTPKTEFCTLHDPLYDTEDSEFGVMRFHKDDIDPSQLPYIDFIQDLSPLFPAFVASDHSISPQLSRIDRPLHSPPYTVSSTSEISIKDIPEPLALSIPGDADLLVLDEPVEDFMEQIQLAMGTSQDSRMKETEKELPGLVDGFSKKIRKVVGRTEKMMLPPVSASPKLTKKRSLPRELDIEEEAVIPPEPVTPTLPTQIPVLRLSPLLSPTAVPSPTRRHGRRRQLLFSDVVDDFTQLSKQYIRDNMATSNNLCYTADEVLPTMPRVTTKELFQLPGRRSITKSETLMALWKSKAVPYQAPEGISIDDIPTWSTDYLEVRQDEDAPSASMTSPRVSPQVKDPRQEMLEASPEQLRDISVESVSKRLRFEDTPVSFSISDVSRLSESRDSTQPSSFQMEPGTVRHKRRLTEQSIEEEVIGQDDKMLMTGLPDDMPPLPEPRYMETLQDIPEAIKSPEISTSEEEQLINVPHQNVIREIAELTAADETITFKDLVPLVTSCSVAAKVFSVCVEYATLKLITVQQEIAYGDIYIRRGPLF